MTLPQLTRRFRLLGLLAIAGLLAAGCIREPPALMDIRQARGTLDKAEASASEKYPEQFKELEKRYLEIRGVYYACRDDEASRLAQALIADVNALMAPRPAAAPPPPPPGNRAPTARFRGPAEGEANILLTFSAEASSDPDGDSLTYKWDFGDDTVASFTFPNATHRYTKAGNFTVRLTVDDGRGGSDSTTGVIAVTRRIVMSEEKEVVLFDFDKADLKPAGQQIVAEVVKEMKENPQLRAHLIGHADAIGTDQYNLGLSKRRAEASRNAMVKQGIAADRITIDWKGESEPIAPNDTREGRAKNRRVEIILSPAKAM